jgi:outer membrane lipoprotein SlyB
MNQNIVAQFIAQINAQIIERGKHLPTLILLVIFVLPACSGYSDPIVDMNGVNQTVYEQDLAECKTYSDDVDTGKGMAKGAAGGAVTGGAVGAISKNGDVGSAAGVGAVLGASRSGVRAANDKEKVVRNCLRYRGYKVLN